MKKSTLYIENKYLEKFIEELPNYSDIIKKREEVSKLLDSEYNQKFWNAYDALLEDEASFLEIKKGAVSLRSEIENSPEFKEKVMFFLKTMIPWRKGPFDFFGIEIDAEWKSDLKWDRIKHHIELKDKKIADVGCNNSYYMYRMLEESPKLVVGFDPIIRYYFNYLMLNKYVKIPKVQFELFGVDELALFPKFFDTILFMGVLYHRRDPLGTLKTINDSLVDDGQIIIECMGIHGDGDFCLFPEERYTKSTGYWFLPTIGALKNMLKRTNFCNIEYICSHKLTVDEQRSTPWVNSESLEDFLDPNDDSKTIEGYPAPIRIYLKAKKKYNKQIHNY